MERIPHTIETREDWGRDVECISRRPSKRYTYPHGTVSDCRQPVRETPQSLSQSATLRSAPDFVPRLCSETLFNDVSYDIGELRDATQKEASARSVHPKAEPVTTNSLPGGC